ncbi:GNAT family N-acetyltransferase [Streptomyces iranensis]|uniref:RimJ/RimL family protein N-acetyltransferase n=2 Tax=Streptomyces iranensis TaxID=576784 RepID=A0ABS4MUQ2_9ACTN|nr:GNAT family N-acetyltransferase [Streptomyces iranensis]MBP2063434.1 RimJ/RimL family protein N-acetyltransferase [Streptomyces iranensis]
MFTVRRAGQYDGDVLGEIHAAAWEAAYAPFFAPEFAARAVQSRRTRWHKRLAQGAGTILLAEHDSRPLAMSAFGPSSARPGLAEILTFYSHPDSWGSGVAAALMTETLRHLRNDKFAQVHLWTLRDTPRSRHFYAKCGFTERGTARTHDFGDGTPLDQVEYERVC